MIMSKKYILQLCFLMVLTLLPRHIYAETDPFKSTPYPVPRFVSLSADEVYVRAGPGIKYPIEWVFKKKGLPVEIVLEYERWRKIKDHEGQEGWIYGALLSGKRTGLVRGDTQASLYKKPKQTSRLKAYLEPRALVFIEKCALEWCKIEAQGHKGWLQKKDIWGVYEKEIFD